MIHLFLLCSTESRTWRDLKMGIAGSSKVAATDQNRSVKKTSIAAIRTGREAPKNPFREDRLASVPEFGDEEPKCQSAGSLKVEEEASSDEVGDEDNDFELKNAEVKFV